MVIWDTNWIDMADHIVQGTARIVYMPKFGIYMVGQ